MTIGGIIFMTLSCGFILFLIIFCFVKVFKNHNEEQVGQRDLLG
jgi:hypothetical protein